MINGGRVEGGGWRGRVGGGWVGEAVAGAGGQGSQVQAVGRLPDDIRGGDAAADVADAHQKDLQAQDKYGVNYLRYWVSEQAGKVFCLVEAGTAADACAVHRNAHGLVADEIFEVVQG